MGNPLTRGNIVYTWEHGRQLSSWKQGSTTWTYTYDGSGMRTGRTNGTTTYSYIYSGGKLMQMSVDEDTFRFAYDASGTPLTITWGDTAYYYTTNLQGDVVAILDGNGTAVVTYTYDAWGNIVSTGGTMASSLGTTNPLRYRGYVYDPETSLYYLQSRYYDPAMGRFINADSYTSTGQGLLGYNMFSYCGNNPVCRNDPLGNIWRRNVSVAEFGAGHSGPIRDATKEIGLALMNELLDAAVVTSMAEEMFDNSSTKAAFIYARFYTLVKPGAPWDVKLKGVWESTIGTSYPGWGIPVQLGDILVTPEEIGNITYGILGYAYGIPLEHLIPGSYCAAGFPIYGAKLEDEILDWYYITIGYLAMQNSQPKE